MGSDNESYSSGSESGSGSESKIKKVKKDKKEKKDKDKDKDSEKKDKKEKKDKDKEDKDKKDKDKKDKKDKDEKDKDKKDKDKKDKDADKPTDDAKAQKHYDLIGVVQPPTMSGNYGYGEAASFFNSAPGSFQGARDHGHQAPFMPPNPPPPVPDFSRAPPPPFPTHNHPFNEQYQQQQHQEQYGGGAPSFPTAQVGDRSLDQRQHQHQPQQSARPPPPPSGYRVPLGPNTPFPQLAQAGEPPFREPGGEPVYVGSALLENPSSVHPCKITVGDRPVCRVAYGGGEIEHHGRYDLLPIDTNTMEWVPTRDGVIPSGRRPVEGGYEEHGARLFHAYADVEGNAVPGKTGEHLSGANISYAGGEHSVSHAYFILCWR